MKRELERKVCVLLKLVVQLFGESAVIRTGCVIGMHAGLRGHAAGNSVLGSVERGLLLCFADVLLVADAFVAEPVAHLAHADAALARQLLFGLFARIRVREVRVEVGVQDLFGLFGEVAPFATRVQETRAQHHHELTSALLELHLNRAEVLAYYGHHTIDLACCDRSCVALFA